MAVTIRPAAIADLDAINEIVHAAYAPYERRLGLKPGPMLDDYGAHIGAGHVHVLEEDGLQGLLVLVPEDDCLLLDNVAVRPAAQGRGYGRILLAFAEDAARAARLPAIRLYTNVAMSENQHLYLRLGYRETHRATEKGLHRVYMRKPLTS